MHIYDGTPSPLPLTSTTELDATVGIASLLEASTKLAHSLGIKTRVQENLLYATKYVGEENAPQDIKRLRRQVHDMMRRMGQPVIIKKMLTIKDVEEGYAERSPNYDNIYGQTRNNDNLSWGAGFVSKEKSKNEWINPSSGQIYKSIDSPDLSWPKAPKYRGFGPGIVTYVIEPDAVKDFFTLTPTGAMIEVQTADVTMAWFPQVNDNDLIIHAELDDYGHIVSTGRRYQAKMTNPVSIRGMDRRGRREYGGDFGNRHVVNQTFPITLVPENNVLMQVETDR
jgi:hypothetical protein